MVNNKTRSRIRGAIVGTAIGDALGMPLEGLKPKTIKAKFGNLRSMVAPKNGTWAVRAHTLRRGQWTDDTQLMLAIGESIVSKGHIDFNDIAQRHVLCLNEPRGWGKSTLSGIGKIKAGTAWWNSNSPDGAGNGPPMKIAPLGVWLALKQIDKFEARTVAINISRMTHGDPRAAVAAIIQMEAIAKAITNGTAGLHTILRYAAAYAASLEFALDDRFDVSGQGLHLSLSKALDTAIEIVEKGGSLSEVRKAVGAGCFVVESFPFTAAAVLKYRDNPEKCLIELMAQGGDTDTTCAMAGALLGAAHGLSSFPKRWRTPLEGYKRLLALADGLSSLEKPIYDPWVRPIIKFGKKNKDTQKAIEIGLQMAKVDFEPRIFGEQ